jgi:hypothetical protein
MSQEIALELLTKREAAEYLKTQSVALLGNDGPTGGLLLKGRFRSLVIGNNALIASNAGVLIDECKIAKALSHRHCTCMKIAVMDLSRSEYEMPTSNRS